MLQRICLQSFPERIHQLELNVLQELALPTFSTLLSSLRMLFSADAGAAGSTACQAAAVAFLLKVHELGDPFAKALSLLVSEFDGPMRESQLSEVVARVGAKAWAVVAAAITQSSFIVLPALASARWRSGRRATFAATR